MSNMIPPINARGLYELQSPWTLVPNQIYTCSAIRKFIDIQNLGFDVFKTYYEPYGLTQTEYNEDIAAGAVIVTLTSETEAPVYVPSTYILKYPNESYHNYQHVVVSASLGPLPDYLDYTHVIQQVGALLSDTIGVVPTVNIHVAASEGSISPEDHDVAEAARQAAVANRVTDRSRLLALEQQNIQLTQQVDLLKQYISDNM